MYTYRYPHQLTIRNAYSLQHVSVNIIFITAVMLAVTVGHFFMPHDVS